MFPKQLISLASLIIPCGVTAGPVQVFGVPLGGKPATPLTICKDLLVTTSPCWVSKPYLHKDKSLLGTINLPDKDLPKWAAYRPLELKVTAQGEIAMLVVNLGEDCELPEVVASVSKRFGRPNDNRLAPSNSYKIASWTTPEIFVHFEKARTYCAVSFRTPEDLEKQLADVKARQVARPATP